MLMEEDMVKQLINSQDEQEFIHLLFQNMDIMKDHNVVQNNIESSSCNCMSYRNSTYLYGRKSINRESKRNEYIHKG